MVIEKVFDSLINADAEVIKEFTGWKNEGKGGHGGGHEKKKNGDHGKAAHGGGGHGGGGHH